MLPSYLRILRVFGLPNAEVTAILRAVRDEGCPGLRLLERDGEFAVCVQVSAPNRDMARDYSEQWIQRLRARFGDAVYGEGEISLAQAALDALLQKRRLIVAVDEATGRLMGALLRPLAHSEAAFDFGHATYADPEKARRIAAPPALLKKFPGDLLQAAAGRAQAALEVSGADMAAAYMPATVGQAPFVLLCDKRGAVACAVSPELGDAAIGNWLLDLARRRALGLHPGDDCITFRPGQDRPLLLVSPEGHTKKGDTTRFSLRRSRARQGDYEPMLDYDAAPAALGQPMTLDSQPAEPPLSPGGAPTGSITFEPPEETPAPAPTPAAAPAPATEPRPASDGNAPGVPEKRTAVRVRPRTIRRPAPTAVPEAAPAPTPAPAAEPAPAEPPAETPAESPAETALPAAGPPAEKRSPLPFPLPETPAEPPHSLLDEEIPDFFAAQPAARPQPSAARTRRNAEAANLLFDRQINAREGAAPAAGHSEALRNRSLAMIEKSERRRRRTVIFVLIVLLLVLAAGAVGIWMLLRGERSTAPDPQAYGTARHDQMATAYLEEVRQKDPAVVGYLAFPGQPGQLVCAAGTLDADGSARPALAEPHYLGAAMPSNTVLTLPAALTAVAEGEQETQAAVTSALAPWNDLAAAQQNSGFTLYLPGGSYRYKVMAVYHCDPADDSALGFDPAAWGDLSRYRDYLAFVLGVQIRSLYATGVQPGGSGRFLTLTAPDADGDLLCVTGRLIGNTESAQLSAASVTAVEDPLRTAREYAAAGQPAPDVVARLSAQLTAFAADRSTGAADDEMYAVTDNTEDIGEMVADMQQRTDALLASADELLAGLTDVAGEADAAEADIEQTADVAPPEETVAVPVATAAPAPTEAPPVATEAPAATAAPTDDGIDIGGEGSEEVNLAGGNAPQGEASSADGETIDVTMNGTAQTLDLVRCLAMIAQNELGNGAPDEAYKAQCVAAHCWIISQSGYPSVAGSEPGEQALAAAREVAHVLVTYNGNVAFTPYFASASTGTASSAEVWGNDRPWLQAVDSPYDRDVSTHWNTNGATSGTARFSSQALRDSIQQKLDIDLSGVDPNDWFKILSANQYGWVAQMQIGPDGGANTTTCSGRWFREVLTARCSVDGRSLRSQCFTYTYDPELDCFIFDVYGYGHGCGMSQWGAVGYARNGWSYADILTHYYPGTVLTVY